LHRRIESYYGAKVRQHGATPEGVDWSSPLTQELRFVQLLRVCEWDRPFSLDDLGCGWGALRGFIAKRHRSAKVDYLGIDLSADMISHAKALWKNRRATDFCVGSSSPRVADYALASGLFNVRIDEPLALWEEFIAQTLRSMAQSTRAGFAANFLATLPEGIASAPQLYRTHPESWTRFCERELGLRVTLLDRYGMREFTLLARH
jgi:SAM-dependent methyltransferase